LNEEHESIRRIRLERQERERMEKELAVSKNYRGLIDLYITRWNNTAMYEIPSLYQKISYNFGMLKDQDGFEKFVADECQVNIGMMSTDKDRNIGILLFIIGMNYPNLSEKEMEVLDELSCDENYFELIESLHIVENILTRPIRKFDRSVLNIRHNEFSNKMLNQVYQAFLENNENYNWYDIKVYDRPSNLVIVVDSEDDVAHKTQFIIDFGLTLSDFLTALKLHFDEDFITELIDRFDSGVDMMSHPQNWSAGESIFDQFEKLVQEKLSGKIKISHLNFTRDLALKWLEKTNKSN
jgi:hypothetical protein